MKPKADEDMLPEYDFSSGVRGKYVARLAGGSNIVKLDSDVQQVFPDSAAVNAALRALAEAVAVANAASVSAPRAKKAPRKTATA